MPLAQRRPAVTAVEPGAELAEIARRRLAGFPATEVVTCAFENWRPRDTPADAVVAIGPRHFPPEAGGLFAEAASLRYPFQVRYSAGDYLANLATQSGVDALGETRRAEFLARVRRRLESLGAPRLTATFVGYLTVERRIRGPVI